jgi:hypothetical protein
MKRIKTLILMSAVLTVALSGCGHGAGPSSGETSGATPTATGAPSATAFHFATAAHIGPYAYSPQASSAMAHDTAANGGEQEYVACVEKDGLNGAGSITSVSYQDYQNSSTATDGLSVIGFQGTFHGDAASVLYQADAQCGNGHSAAVPATPGPNGGTLYTYTEQGTFSNSPSLPSCTWSTGSTVGMVTFFDTSSLWGTSLAATCLIVRASVETR